jgi:hypothetical protein
MSFHFSPFMDNIAYNNLRTLEPRQYLPRPVFELFRLTADMTGVKSPYNVKSSIRSPCDDPTLFGYTESTSRRT